jgi:hypothetical protein
MALYDLYGFLSKYKDSMLNIPKFITSVKVKKLLMNWEPLLSRIKKHFPDIPNFLNISLKILVIIR